MRYQLADGVTTVKFVRPAHGLIALHGADVVPVTALGLAAGRETLGHRFMSNGSVAIPDADAYAATLADKGRVMASFEGRRADIERQLLDHAGRLSATLGDDPEVAALLDEVTALVEHPTVYVGEFEEQFLQVPQECLILTMRLNQKYFPLFEPASGRLTHRFLIVSNMHTANPVNIVEGNQRVVRPRLADAQFFFNTDRKTPLAARVEQLGAIVYHNKLGTQLERVERVRAIAGAWRSSWAATSRPPTAPPCWPRPIWARTWWASSPSCKASWARTTRPATANRPAWSRRCAPSTATAATPRSTPTR